MTQVPAPDQVASVPGALRDFKFSISPPAQVSSDADTSCPRSGDAVTVSVTRPNTGSQILSFILSASQAAPWLEAATSLLTTNSTITLHSASLPSPITVTLTSWTKSAIPVLDAVALREAGNVKLREADNTALRATEKFRTVRAAQLLYSRSAAAAQLNNDVEAGAAARSNGAMAALRADDNLGALANAYAADVLRGRKDAKTAFRRARAATKLNMYVPALAELADTQRLAPDDPAVKTELESVREEWTHDVEARRKQFAEVYNVMLNSPLFKDPLRA